MSIRLMCPNPECGLRLKVKDELAGKKVKCPECGGIIAVPGGEAQPDPLIGKQIAHYKILALVGEGGMASVYKARNLRLNKIVALKILPQSFVRENPAFADRFIREARSAAQLEHPNVVSVYFVGMEEGHYFIEMQFVDGPTVREIIRSQGKMDIAEATRIIIEAAKALAAAHEKGIIHRDVKPDNIMLSKDGSVKVADFGLAKLIDAEGEQFAQGRVIGTPFYMSPEQCQGKTTDARSDIYSLGATYFHMLAGRPPFTGEDKAAIIRKHVNDPLPSIRSLREDVPQEVENIINKMMAKNPDERYQNCAELIEDLQKVAATMAAPVAVTEVPDEEAVEVVPETSGIWVFAATITIVLIVAGSAIWILLREQKKRTAQPKPSVKKPVESAAERAGTQETVPPAAPEPVKEQPAPAAKAPKAETEPPTPAKKEGAKTEPIEVTAPPEKPTTSPPPPKPKPTQLEQLQPAKPKEGVDYDAYAEALSSIEVLIDERNYQQALLELGSLSAWRDLVELKRDAVLRLSKRWEEIVKQLSGGGLRIPMKDVSRRYAFAGDIVGADEKGIATEGKVRMRFKWEKFGKDEMYRLWVACVNEDDPEGCIDLALFCMEGKQKFLDEAEKNLSRAAMLGANVEKWRRELDIARRLPQGERAPEPLRPVKHKPPARLTEEKELVP